MPEHWIHDAVGYEVYVRSFQDTTGSGFGDLEGVRRRLDHLVELGVDVVWLTPIYPSPDADHGYDVADYRSVDRRYGGDEALDRLLREAHDRGLRVVMDIVPNHTSDQHPWFLDARTGPDAEHRDWYVWRDPAPDGGPPNGWIQHFGGPAWTFDEASGQYWMHLFLPEQPDLNWHNPAVRDDFVDTLRMWFTRGVDGFRIDVAHALLEDPEFRDNPLHGSPPGPGAHPRAAFEAYDHLYDLDQDDNPALYARWRKVADLHGAALIGEVYLTDPDRWARYLADDALHSGFWFPTLHIGWDAEVIRRTLEAALTRRGERTSWPISSHDDPYAATRFGGGERGRQRALAFTTLCSILPGAVFVMQGEELGLENAQLPPEALTDPVSVRNEGAAGRDGTRAPMPWEAGHGHGFTSGTPWLPFGANRPDTLTVAAQWQTPDSHLRRMRDLFHLRRVLPRAGGHAFLDHLPEGIIGARVGDTTVLVNATDAQVTVDLGEPGTVRFVSTHGAVAQDVDGWVDVPRDAAVVVRGRTGD